VLERSSSSPNGNQVVSIKQRGTSGEGYRVALADGSSFFIAADALLAVGIATGDVLTEEQWVALEDYAERYRARRKAYDLLARSEHSTFLLEHKLRQRGFTEPAVAEAVEAARRHGYLDDRRFAERWIESRLRKHPEARSALLAGLFQRGVPRSVAEEALSVVATDDAISDALRRAGEQAVRRAKGKPSRAYRSLCSRGFSSRDAVAYLTQRGVIDGIGDLQD
jgi:regulatory protein